MSHVYISNPVVIVDKASCIYSNDLDVQNIIEFCEFVLLLVWIWFWLSIRLYVFVQPGFMVFPKERII